jgi:hypothetical protein
MWDEDPIREYDVTWIEMGDLTRQMTSWLKRSVAGGYSNKVKITLDIRFSDEGDPKNCFNLTHYMDVQWYL